MPVPKQIRVPAGAIEVAALDYANEGAPPLVLLHGIRDLAWSMDSIASALCDDHRVIALDLRGHGDSDKPGVYTIPHYVADLASVLRALGIERTAIVGHSLGGQIVSQFAALFPEAVSALVLVEGLGPPIREGEGDVDGRRQMARSHVDALLQPVAPRRSMPDLDEAVGRVRRNHPRLDPERARFLTERGTEPHPDGGLQWKWDPAVQGTWGSVTREQNEERWGWIECPVLVVTGGDAASYWTQRRFTSGSRPRPSGEVLADELARRVACFGNARSLEIAGAGHMVHFDQPEGLNAAIAEFLGENVSR